MKRNHRFFLAACLLSSLLVVNLTCKKDPPEPEPEPPTPTYTCTSNITDGCMDDWKLVTTPTGNYIDPMQGFLATLNELYSVPPEAGGPGPLTADTVTDCMQGKYAVKLTAQQFHVMAGLDIFIPGYVGASVLDIPNATIHLGKPYTQRPQRLQAYYKYAPVDGDSALIQVMLTRWNTANAKRDTIANDRIVVKNAVSSYTQLDLPLTYYDNVSTPDTLVLLFATSAGIDFGDLQKCHGQIGSTMWVDDLKFIFP